MPASIRLFIFLFLFCAQSCMAAIVASNVESPAIDMTIYSVQAIGPYEDPDEILINDKLYDPKTYCEISAGDKVRFIVHVPDDCVDAKILNLRNRTTCDVWCEG